MNKAILAPIVAAVLLLVKQLTGYEGPGETADIITNAVLGIIALVGVFMEPRTAPSPTRSEEEQIEQNGGGGEYKDGGGGEQ
jgi:uncharacterized membrane protein